MGEEAFITGSHAYGTPTDKSDVDLVVLCDEVVANKLVCLLGEEDQLPGASNCEKGVSIKLGNLNLIMLPEDHFVAWRTGTNNLCAIKPVTRDAAITEIKKQREAIDG